jgi:hypothetical protein
MRVAVAEVEEDIHGHHQGIEGVEEDHEVVMEYQLMEYAGRIADEDHEKEGQALAGDLARLPGLIDGERPGRPETYQHDYLEDAHDILFPPEPRSPIIVSWKAPGLKLFSIYAFLVPMSDHEEGIFGKETVNIAIDNIIFEGLDDLIAAVEEAQKAAREDGHKDRLKDLEKMKGIITKARREIENVLKDIGKRAKG